MGSWCVWEWERQRFDCVLNTNFISFSVRKNFILTCMPLFAGLLLWDCYDSCWLINFLSINVFKNYTQIHCVCVCLFDKSVCLLNIRRWECFYLYRSGIIEVVKEVKTDITSCFIFGRHRVHLKNAKKKITHFLYSSPIRNTAHWIHRVSTDHLYFVWTYFWYRLTAKNWNAFTLAALNIGYVWQQLQQFSLVLFRYARYLLDLFNSWNRFKYDFVIFSSQSNAVAASCK